MDKRNLQRTMYELGDTSTAQRITLAILAGACVLAAWWKLAGAGLNEIGGRLGWTLRPGDEARRMCLAAAFSIYYVRSLFTEFVFLKRGIGWNEVFTIALWLLIIVLLLGITGGTNDAPSVHGLSLALRYSFSDRG